MVRCGRMPGILRICVFMSVAGNLKTEEALEGTPLARSK